MTEETVGGQHHSNEATRNRAHRVNTDERSSSSLTTERVCPEEANTPKKRLATTDLIRETALIVAATLIRFLPRTRFWDNFRVVSPMIQPECSRKKPRRRMPPEQEQR
jgi:hypothetical protein